MKIKSLIITVVLSIAILFSFPGATKGATISELLVRMAELQARVISLQSQIFVQENTTLSVVPPTTKNAWCYNFTKNLGYAQSGRFDVGALHIALSREGISYNPDAGNIYGRGTMNAVKVFQIKYGSYILSKEKRNSGTGYVGRKTREKLNALYGCLVDIVSEKNYCTQLNSRITINFGASCGEERYDVAIDIDNDGHINSSDQDIYANNSTDQDWCKEKLEDTTDSCLAIDYCFQLKTRISENFGASCNSKYYEPTADIDNNGRIESIDISFAIEHSTDQDWCKEKLEDRADPCEVKASEQSAFSMFDAIASISQRFMSFFGF